MFTLAAALSLMLAGAQEPPPGTVFDDDALALLDDCAAIHDQRIAERATWTIIDARAMTSPAALTAALQRAAPAGKRIVILGGAFPGADMRPVAPQLVKACLVDMTLDGSNWEATYIPQLQLVRTSLRDAKAARARWPGLRTRGADIEGADFSGADLTGMRFVSAYRGAAFGGTRFAGANLKDASFACGITVDVWCINAAPDFTGADLTGADVSGLGLWEPELNTGAALDRTTVAPRSLPQLRAARITGPLLLATYYTSPYDETPGAVRVEITAEEARSLIASVPEDVPPTDTPSFACSQARTPAEMLICGEEGEDLRLLDREMAVLWRAVRAAGNGDLAAQRRWLAGRGACDNAACLTARYEARIGALRGALGPGIALKPGERVTYHSEILPLPDRLRAAPLYVRILPALIDASHQTVTLTGARDGTLSATGEAVGANAHMCDLGVEAARFDPASGWWSVVAEDGRMVPLLRIEGRRIHFRYSGNLGDTPEEAGDFISCGARAAFDSGIDLSAP